MSDRMTIECACERGGNCTSISACSADSMLQDQADEYDNRIEQLKAENTRLREQIEAVLVCDQHLFINFQPDLSDRKFFIVDDVLAELEERERE